MVRKGTKRQVPSSHNTLKKAPPAILTTDRGGWTARHFQNHKTAYITLVGWILLSIIGAYLLYRRYPYSFTMSNFYAEDGKLFTVQLFDQGVFRGIFTFFNGYLVLLQYAAMAAAMGVNHILGGSFASLPKAYALVSYATLSLAATLPWLLFRHRLGNWWAVLLSLLLIYMPLGSWDYTVIGTIGNLKFLFFYVATLLIIYRNDSLLVRNDLKRMWCIDVLLLLCVLTNITVVGVLPLALYRYRTQLREAFYARSLRGLPASFWGLIGLGLISVGYIVLVMLRGVPKMPGYLDEPLHRGGLYHILFRGSWYGVLYPLYGVLNGVFVNCLLVASLLVVALKKYRFFWVTIIVSVLCGTLGFVINRPGVTHYFDGFGAGGGPAQFFYGSAMVFVFGLFYAMAAWVKNLSLRGRLGLGVAVVLYLLLCLPLAGYGAKSYQTYAQRPDVYHALAAACAKPGKQVTVAIYPTDSWQMVTSREKACSK